MFQKQSMSGLTGKLFEAECLYAQGRSPEQRHFQEIDYLPLREAIIECIQKHPGYSKEELSDPPSLWMNDVLYVIAEELHAPLQSLQVFPTLGLAADRYHGIDFFIVYTDPLTGAEAIVTVDLSEQDVKIMQGYKADIIVSSRGAAANPQLYDLEGENSFVIPSLTHASKEEERQEQHAHRIRTGQMIAEVLQEKIAHGDLHYGAMYERSEFRQLHHAIRESLQSLFPSTESHVTR